MTDKTDSKTPEMTWWKVRLHQIRKELPAGWQELLDLAIDDIERELRAADSLQIRVRYVLQADKMQWVDAATEARDKLSALHGRLAGERERVIEECAKVCEQIWKDAPNDIASGFEQNDISHGCFASAKAIRALAAQVEKEKS